MEAEFMVDSSETEENALKALTWGRTDHVTIKNSTNSAIIY